METKRQVIEDLNPQHLRLRRSNLAVLHQLEHCMYCQRYPMCGTEQSAGTALLFKRSVMWTVIWYIPSGTVFENDIWLLLPRRGAQIRSPVRRVH